MTPSLNFDNVPARDEMMCKGMRNKFYHFSAPFTDDDDDDSSQMDAYL